MAERDEEAIATLERVLAQAREGKVRQVAVAWLSDDDTPSLTFTSARRSIDAVAMLGAVAYLEAEMFRVLRRVPAA